MSPLARSAKIISDGLMAKGKKTVSVPEREEQLRAVQNQYRREKDKYLDRPLPPVRKRLNFGPGRAQLGSKWKNFISKYAVMLSFLLNILHFVKKYQCNKQDFCLAAEM